jgi:hypothetical protein
MTIIRLRRSDWREQLGTSGVAGHCSRAKRSLQQKGKRRQCSTPHSVMDAGFRKIGSEYLAKISASTCAGADGAD